MQLPKRRDGHHGQCDVGQDGICCHEVRDVVQHTGIPATSGQRRIPELLDRCTLDVDDYARDKREDDLEHRHGTKQSSPPEPRVEEAVHEDSDGDVGQSECN